MSNDRDWCHVPNCDVDEEQVGECDYCGVAVCQHHALIIGENDWKCMKCAEVKADRKSLVATVVLLAVFLALVIASVAFGQDKPKDPPKPPEVKAEVKVELLKAQNDLWKLNAQLRQLQDQSKTLQDQFTAAQTRYQQAVSSALQKSGIDDKKWQLNPETLDVTPRPEEPKTLPPPPSQPAPPIPAEKKP